MTRFESLRVAPGETRRILRGRFERKLAVAKQSRHPNPQASVISDILAFQVMDRLVISHHADWATAEAAYGAAGPTGSEPPDLHAAIEAGWLRHIWGRASIPRDVRLMALRAEAGTMDAFKSLSSAIHGRSYRFNVGAPPDPALASLISEITAGTRDPATMPVRTPEWIAARLWESIRVGAASDADALRRWADLFGVLWHHDFVPAQVWNEADSKAFRDTTLDLIASEPALGDWAATRDLYIKQTALAQRATERDAALRFPAPPDSLIGRALWIEEPMIESCCFASLEAGSDLFGLVRLLLADIDDQDFAPGPHPLAAQIIDLALDRAELFMSVLFGIRNRPRLLADLVLHPRSAALACFLIARWTRVGEAWERDRADSDYSA